MPVSVVVRVFQHVCASPTGTSVSSEKKRNRHRVFCRFGRAMAVCRPRANVADAVVSRSPRRRSFARRFLVHETLPRACGGVADRVVGWALAALFSGRFRVARRAALRSVGFRVHGEPNPATAVADCNAGRLHRSAADGVARLSAG